MAAQNQAALSQAFTLCLSPDTATIKRGEAQLKKFTKKDTCVEALCVYCGTSPDGATRLQAALCLKKNVAKYFKKFDHARKAQVKTQLLVLLSREPEKNIATALAGCVAKVANAALGDAPGWPELFQTLVTLGQDANERNRALNYNLLGQMAEHLPDKLLVHMDTIAQMLTTGCQDSSNTVKKEAMVACSMFIGNCSEFDEVEKLKCVLTPMLNVMTTCLQNGDEEAACEGLEVVSDCASLDKPLINDHLEVSPTLPSLSIFLFRFNLLTDPSSRLPSLFSTTLQMLVPFLLAIVQSPTLEAKTKSAASTAVMHIVESRPKLLASKSLVTPILTSMAQIIAASEGAACGSLYTMPSAAALVENDDERDEDYQSEDSEEQDATQQAQIILNSMALHVPSKFFTEPALAMASQCMSNPDPKMRKAGTAIVGIITEGCADSIRPLLDRILPAMLAAVTDSDQSVREVACFAMGQFSEYLQPDILHHNQAIFPVLAAALEDVAENVRNTACYVLEMFVENLQKETLRPHLPRLMQQLAQLLQSSSRVSQEMALSGIGACAVAAETDFAPYTPGICQLLSQLINLTEPKQFSLRGRSLETMGHIAVAVGADTFAPYFELCMNSAIQGVTLPDDSLKEHSYVSFANLAKVMGPSGRFAPFLPNIVPVLLDVVNEPELMMSDDEDEDDDDEVTSQDLAQGDDDDEHPSSFYINNAEGFVNGKKAALTALGSFGEHCGSHFAPHLESVVTAIVNPQAMSSIDSQHEIVRAEAIEILRYLFENLCKLSGVNTDRPPKTYAMLELPESVKALAGIIINNCLRTIEGDDCKKPVATALETIGSLTETASAVLLMLPVDSALNPDKTGPVGGVLIESLIKLLQGEGACQVKPEHASPDEDEDDEDHDHELIDSVSDIIGTLAKQMGPSFEAYFDRMLPLLLKYCKTGRPFTDLSMAIGCFGEVVAEIGPNAIKYQAHLLPIAQAGLSHQMEGVRRNSAYFIGQFVESTGTALSPYYGHILTWMHPLCIRPESKKTFDAGGADVDNALSAVARMIRAGKDSVPLPQVLPVLLQAMPLQSDFTEGLNIFTCLMGLLQAGDTTAMGLLPQILINFAQAIVHDSKYEDESKALVVAFFRSSVSLPHMQEALSQLPPEVQRVINENMGAQ